MRARDGTGWHTIAPLGMAPPPECPSSMVSHADRSCFTHVSHMARSPVVGRTLADHGATVLKIISHERPRREMFDCETNHGKRTLVLELSTAEGKQRLWDLLKVSARMALRWTSNDL